ncbi:MULTISPECIES: M48 family metalloprotease [Pseudomonas]|jgi:hypothetical protein|uniref:Beta-barrel assembly-enhancing protease n=1 Tax=Pseudomonas fluorescens TaxID=294 RepID=A0A5E7T8V7_PSEFL|nr:MULTISPECIES: M48 family metalloprotease [Pseudomonas]QCY11763.1 hypothetical protein ELQ88_13720 [Pseudomonas sp. MPC6]VVP94568.1 Beta-barrel assembly-enhancing protease [Pseudomonas fluorescens]
MKLCNATLWAPALAALLAACSASQLSNPFDSAKSDVKVKQITTLSPRALVVLDKNCPELVQPYQLTDNFASLAVFSMKESIKDLPGQLGHLLGKTPAQPGTDKLSDSTRLAAKQLNWMPMTAEELYAERQHNARTDVLSRESKLGRKYYPTADKMLREILASVDEPYDYRFKLFILKTSNRNALALPGGYLYIDQGLLDSPERQPKAYFALAHEVSHVLQRHETKEMQSLVVDSFSVKKELIDTLEAAKSNPAIVVDRVKLEKGQFTKHHVDQELQADSCAVRMLSHVYPNNKDLAASINAFEADLPKMEPSAPAKPPSNDGEALAESMHDIVKSPVMRHPNTRERTENLQAIYREVSSATTAAK